MGLGQRLAAVVFLVLFGTAEAGVWEVLPAASWEKATPTPEKVLGYSWGEEISDPEQIARFARALAEAFPERVKLLPYARSLEGRELFLLVVGKPEFLRDLEALAARLRALGDPRVAGKQDPGELPAVVWLVGSVHGDEASGGEAALVLAQYLAGSRNPEVEALLEKVLVVLDPMQNPDGRARFVASTRQARGPEPDLEPASAEHVQPWPGGRFSHLLFDLNRDWFALTHPESQGRVERMLWLHPQVVVDLHEMGADQGYFFPPPAPPHNPLVSREQNELWKLLGLRLAAAFDSAGVRFWTREVFDAFYPGYGESWPFFSGACGATFEQASTRGRAVRLSSGEVLHYADAVAHHVLAAFTTLRTVAEQKQAFFASFLEFRRNAVREGQGKAYVFDGRQEGAAPLAALLAKQGLEVFLVEAGGFPQYLVPQGQPLGKLAQVLLSREVPLPQEFVAEQQKREAKRLPDEIYDITAWSLPLLWNVVVEEKPMAVPAGAQRVGPEGLRRGEVLGEGKVAFLMPWEGLSSAQALVALLRAGVRARVANKPFTLGGREYPRGSVVLFSRENPEKLREKLAQVAQSTGARFFGTDTSFADKGVDLGSNQVRPVTLPAVALAWDQPALPTAAGHLRYALERQLGLPVSVIRTASLGSAELRRFAVIVLPDASSAAAYGRVLAPEALERLAHWIQEGGVLVAEGEAAAFLTQEKVGLLASELLKRSGKKAQKKDDKQAGEPASSYEEAIQPEEEEPPMVPGAILAVKLDQEELLTAGCGGPKLYVLVNSRRVFAPLKLDAGRNLAVFAPEGELVASGFVFADSKKLLPEKPYFMMQRHGRGLVLAFAEPPAFRGMTRASTLLLANSVLFGPTLVSGR